MFTPVSYYAEVVAWFTQHYTDTWPGFSLLVHTNTGCEYEDHSKWALWAGTPW
jgi:aromatic ring-cleaving dioxygenase